MKYNDSIVVVDCCLALVLYSIEQGQLKARRHYSEVLQVFMARGAVGGVELASVVKVCKAMIGQGSRPGLVEIMASELCHAAKKGHHERLGYLLEMGASANAHDEHGVKAINSAAYYGQFQCLEELLDRGADPNATDKDGVSVAMDAALGGSHACVGLVLDRGGRAGDIDGHGKSVAMFAIEHPQSLGRICQDIFDFESALENGKTLFMAAAESGIVESLEIIVKFGGNPMAIDKQGRDVSMWAAASGKLECLKFLARIGALDGLRTCHDGLDVVAYAERCGKESVISFVLGFKQAQIECVALCEMTDAGGKKGDGGKRI